MTTMDSKKCRYAAGHRRSKVFDISRGNVVPLLQDSCIKLSGSGRSAVKLHNATLKQAPNPFDWAHIWRPSRPRKKVV